MKRLITAALALTLLAWGQGLAAQTTHTESETKRTGPGPNVKVETEIVSGQVKEYEAGKEIEIEGPGGKNHEFDLDKNARVEGAIVVGQMATVHYTKENGIERVVVLAAGAPKTAHGEHAGHAAPALTTGEKAHMESTTKRTGPGPNTKTKTEVVVGTVKEYEAGKEIEIEGPGGKNHEFDLDKNARVEGSIVVGQMATVHYTKENGRERVLVLAAGAPKAPMAGGHPGHAAPSVKPGETAHMESTTKHTGPGPNTKTKTEVVVGTVKEYEAGKEIEVEGPGGKNYEFDLDEQVLVQGAIVKGQQVKVEYTKMDDGTERVVILAPMVGTKPGSKKVKG